MAWRKCVLLALVATVVGATYLRFGSALTLEGIAASEMALRHFQANNPVVVYGAAFVIYAAVTGLSLPGATAMTLVFGWYFGFTPGLVVVSFASTAGATLAFLLSRYILRNTIQSKFGERLSAFNEALALDGAVYLFTLRLVPAVPFFVINLVMGLTTLRASTFLWVSQVGMLPGTAVFVYAGAVVPDLQTLSQEGTDGILSSKLVVAFVLLGVFPLLVKRGVQRFRNQKHRSL